MANAIKVSAIEIVAHILKFEDGEPLLDGVAFLMAEDTENRSSLRLALS